MSPNIRKIEVILEADIASNIRLQNVLLFEIRVLEPEIAKLPICSLCYLHSLTDYLFPVFLMKMAS